MIKNNTVLRDIEKLPEGFSKGVYENNTYKIIKTKYNKGKSYKVYAKELGGTNFISLNFYKTQSKELLRPCEMTNKKVIHFLKNVELT